MDLDLGPLGFYSELLGPRCNSFEGGFRELASGNPGLIHMHGERHFNSSASTTRQRKNPHPATSMAVLRAPHQATTSASLAKFRNRSKPCCQPVKAMLKNWSTGQSHVALLFQNVFTATADNWRCFGTSRKCIGGGIKPNFVMGNKLLHGSFAQR